MGKEKNKHIYEGVKIKWGGGGGIFIFTDKTEQKLCFIDSSTKSKKQTSFYARRLGCLVNLQNKTALCLLLSTTLSRDLTHYLQA